MARVNPEPAIQIISTLGPSLANQQTLRSVIRAGSLIFRQNIFYETTEDGWGGDTGYVVAVGLTTPGTVAVDAQTWSDVKAMYR